MPMDLAQPSAPPPRQVREHRVVFYESLGFLAESVAGFLAPALSRDQPIVLVATPAHRDAIRSALELQRRARGITTPARVVTFDAERTLSSLLGADGMPVRERFFAVVNGALDRATRPGQGPVKVHAYGEMVALLWARGAVEGAIALEELWNEVADRRPLALHCGYPFAAFSGEDTTEDFQRVCRRHSVVLPSDSYSRLPTDDERARAVAVLQQEAVAGITERVVLRHRQHHLEDALVRSAGVEHLQREALAGILQSLRGPAGQPDRVRDLASLQKTVVRTVRRVLGAVSCSFLAPQAPWTGGGSPQEAAGERVELLVAGVDAMFGLLVVQLPPGRTLEDEDRCFLERVTEVLSAAFEHHHLTSAAPRTS